MGVHPDEVRLSLNVYSRNGLELEQIERHWLTGLRLPQGCCRKHFVDHTPTSSSGRKRNKLPYGVCTLTVNSTRIVQHIYGAVLDEAGLHEPKWLD